ncbi:MAG TPA: 50S ribosomal protein L23 [Methanoregulaceae archaeon]|nr:50S ribosomal protein L23 [Methanoregulaceae archaeon]
MILRFPFVTEKAMAALENNSKLQFLVDNRATKPEIKRELEAAFGHPVAAIRTINTTDGRKKAMVSFEDPKAAEEILSRLGVM